MRLNFEPTTYAGTFLVALPTIRDPSFRGSVVYLCAHSSDGAMGVVVNRPAPLSTYSTLRDRLPRSLAALRSGALHIGGPAETQRCFVLHPPAYRDGTKTLVVDRHHALTATDRVLADIPKGAGPDRRIVALGYAGWGPGQLEGELRGNAWIVVPSDPNVTFAPDDADKWRRAIAQLGVEPETLSGMSGTA